MTTIRPLSELTPRQCDELCALLIDAVEGGASVGFLAPLTRDAAGEYWRSVQEAQRNGLELIVAEEDGGIAGAVQLSPCPKSNGAHRAEIQKLFVLRSDRGKGLGSRLMAVAEARALALGRTLLVLDTHQGSAAEALYDRLGWQRAGVIPDYAASPDGTLHGTVFFYKRIGDAKLPRPFTADIPA